MSKVLIIEGVSNSGKTTLCELLRLRKSLAVLPEGIRYLEKEMGTSRDLIMSTPKTLEEERRNQDLLFHAQELRARELIEVLKRERGAVLDKSALSILATAYAFEAVPGLVGDLPHAVRGIVSFANRLQAARLDTRFALLVTEPSVRMMRNAGRPRPLDSIWVDSRVVAAQQKFLESMLVLFGDKGRMFDGASPNLFDEVSEFYERPEE